MSKTWKDTGLFGPANGTAFDVELQETELCHPIHKLHFMDTFRECQSGNFGIYIGPSDLPDAKGISTAMWVGKYEGGFIYKWFPSDTLVYVRTAKITDTGPRETVKIVPTRHLPNSNNWDRGPNVLDPEELPNE